MTTSSSFLFMLDEFVRDRVKAIDRNRGESKGDNKTTSN